MKTKTHTTVKITKALLQKYGACQRGLDEVKDLLPATLSTDPSGNIKLALALAEIQYGDCICCTWVSWLEFAVNCGDKLGDFAKRQGDFDLDPGNLSLLIQQQLANIADTLASREGR